jgi:hypothetical protein
MYEDGLVILFFRSFLVNFCGIILVYISWYFFHDFRVKDPPNMFLCKFYLYLYFIIFRGF